MLDVALSRLDERVERVSVAQGRENHDTREERWRGSLAWDRSLVAHDGGYGPGIQSRHKRMLGATSRLGVPGSYEPYHGATKSSRSAEAWTETRHRQSLRSSHQCHWGSFLAGATSVDA
jgi:hypothetical protein